MKIRIIIAFSLGVLLFPTAVGTLKIVEASGAKKTHTACADKKSGVMRYLNKGNCKKTERRISWNQQGPQGEQGLQGAQGLPGQQGANAVANSFAIAASVFDVNGVRAGQLVGVDSNNFLVLTPDGTIWRLDSHSGETQATISLSDFFSDSNCELPLTITPRSLTFNNQITYRYYESEIVYKADSIYSDISDMSKPVFQWVWETPGSPTSARSCTLTTQLQRETRSPDSTLLTLAPVDPPVFTGPLRIVGQ